MIGLGVVAVVAALSLDWALWLRFCRHVFDVTGDPCALREAAAVASAFRRDGQRAYRRS